MEHWSRPNEPEPVQQLEFAHRVAIRTARTYPLTLPGVGVGHNVNRRLSCILHNVVYL